MDPNHGLTNANFVVFESDVFMVQTGLFCIETIENRFFTIHFYDLLNGDPGGYKG